MDKKQELIKQCRYYKGEIECPNEIISSVGSHVWICERDWVLWESADAFNDGKFTAPFGYSQFWTDDIKIPEVDGYTTPINLLKMLFSYYCYFSGVHSRDILKKEVSCLKEGRWIRVSAIDGFKLFLKDRYYSSDSKSHSNTK